MSRAIAYLREHATVEQEGRAVRLPPEQLERKFYEEVDDVLTRLGGKWNGRKRLHLFPYDVSAVYQAVLDTGILPPKNPTAFFPTPASLVAEMVALAELNDRHLVLEPSAGTGAIADAVREAGAAVHCCEVLDLNRAALTAKGYELVGADFLAYAPGPIYDAVLMNPPFSLDGDKLAYITHINHAWTLLKEGGMLVAITPTGFEYRTDKRTASFRDFICEYGEWSKNGAGLFKESGTGIDTATVWLRKDTSNWRRQAFHGWESWHSRVTALWAENGTKDLSERVRAAAASAPIGTLTPAFRDVLAEVVKLARESGDPLNPTDADLLEVLAHFHDELRDGRDHPAPAAQPQPDLGPLFALEAS